MSENVVQTHCMRFQFCATSEWCYRVRRTHITLHRTEIKAEVS